MFGRNREHVKSKGFSKGASKGLSRGEARRLRLLATPHAACGGGEAGPGEEPEDQARETAPRPASSSRPSRYRRRRGWRLSRCCWPAQPRCASAQYLFSGPISTRRTQVAPLAQSRGFATTTRRSPSCRPSHMRLGAFPRGRAGLTGASLAAGAVGLTRGRTWSSGSAPIDPPVTGVRRLCVDFRVF